ncbi:MAG: alpha-L-fucosidase [Planctomycetota bacterium]
MDTPHDESLPPLVPRHRYVADTRASRPRRIQWWREARFGMFIHFGLYALLGRHEWAMATECIPASEYEQLADRFAPAPGAPRRWAKLARTAGMKYVVLTAKHHEGFCLWDTQQTDYNAARRGPRRDLIAEYVDACRAEGLRVGLYYSMMDWHHPDGGACLYDPAARERFLRFTRGCVRELMSNYGRIDILWYDGGRPLMNPEGWQSDALNQMVRSLQPDILINNRARLDEDFSTPEGSVTAARVDEARGWEACMTFNGTSWGYMRGADVDAWRARDIVKMLAKAGGTGGNLLLNIGPMPDGAVPPDAVGPLQATGRWLQRHGEAIYGNLDAGGAFPTYCGRVTRKGRRVYFWREAWSGPEQGLGGYETKLEGVTCLTTGEPVDFEQQGYRILLKNLPRQCPDPEAQVAVYALDFAEPPVFKWLPTTPAFTARWTD